MGPTRTESLGGNPLDLRECGVLMRTVVMLLKQGWRLQTNTRTLVYYVLIARYFPNSDFLHAELGRQPSYAWRSIMASTFRAVTLPNALHIDSTVSELIDEATDA